MDDYDDENEMLRVAEELSLLSRIADATKAEPVWTTDDTHDTHESVALLEQVIDTHIASLKDGPAPGTGPGESRPAAGSDDGASAAATGHDGGAGGDNAGGVDMAMATEVAEKLRTYQVRHLQPPPPPQSLRSASLSHTSPPPCDFASPRLRLSARSNPRPKT
jgi:hypothetical protein